jgi:hypothetical protein
MRNHKQNLKIRIIGIIFAAINLALLSLSLSSCTNEVDTPLKQTEQQKERYKNQSTQKPESDRENDDDDDEKGDDDNK